MDVTTTTAWECDGCGQIGTEDEVTAHIMRDGTNQDGTLKEPAEVRCWGAMEVGDPAWTAYHTQGRHPMTTIVDQVAELYTDHMLRANGIETQ